MLEWVGGGSSSAGREIYVLVRSRWPGWLAPSRREGRATLFWNVPTLFQFYVATLTGCTLGGGGEGKKNMSTVRYFYTDTTGYAKYMFRIYRTVVYFTKFSPDDDISTIKLSCVHRTVVFGATQGSHGHDHENNCYSLMKSTDASEASFTIVADERRTRILLTHTYTSIGLHGVTSQKAKKKKKLHFNISSIRPTM